MKSLRPEYKEKSKVKFRIVGRERYPTKSYSNTASEYLTAKYLPSGSVENIGGTGTYYSVRDTQTEDVIIPYGTGSMVSCDSTGNYFNLWMNGLQAERYYKFEFKVVSGSNTVDETIQYFEDANGNNVWDEGEYFVDIGNGIWDKGEKYYSIAYVNSKSLDKYKQKESYLGYIPYDNGTDGYSASQLVDRKKINMDYLSKIDTLTSDSLYSSINSFKHGYEQKDLFEIEVNRFNEESYLLKLHDNNNFSEENKCSDIQNISSDMQLVSVLLPFLSSPIQAELYYENLDTPNITISSPVPKNEYLTYWQKINLVSINDINEGNYTMSSFSIPTPFSFYTGDGGKIVNHIKSWID